MRKILFVTFLSVAALSISSCGENVLSKWTDLGELPFFENNADYVNEQNTAVPNVAIVDEVLSQQPEASKEAEQSDNTDKTDSQSLIPTVPTQTDSVRDDEILEKFEKACVIYKSFHGRCSGTQSDYNDSLNSDGVTYYRTTIEWTSGINTKSDLVAYIGTIFSDELVNDMINIKDFGEKGKIVPYIADTDKGLYTLLGEFAMGDSMEYAGDVKYEVIKESDSKLIVRVTAKYYPEDWLFDDSIPEDQIEYRYRTRDYPMEHIDNEWKFTRFDIHY